MADYIGGIAILDRRDPRREHLSCFGFRDNKHPTYISIPVYPKGTPKPSDCAWEYEVVGDQLNCCPSVRQLAGNNGPEIFHNTYNWTVKFKDAVSDPYEELKAANPGCSQFE
jgi:hypothetical protein